jgi:hypothetical protein
MGTVVKAQFIREVLCQKCFAAHHLSHDTPVMQEPFRKVVENFHGVTTCTGCGRRVNRGYIVVYECTSIKAVSRTIRTPTNHTVLHEGDPSRK